MPLTYPPIEFKLILCDSAQADPATGKLHMLGAGWGVIPTPTPPHAVALMVQVPWSRTDEQLHVTLELFDGDGRSVTVPGPHEEPQRVRQEADLEVGRAVGVAEGTAISASFAVNVGPLPLPAGRYEWRATIANDDPKSEFFQVVTPRQAPVGGAVA